MIKRTALQVHFKARPDKLKPYKRQADWINLNAKYFVSRRLAAIELKDLITFRVTFTKQGRPAHQFSTKFEY